MVDNKLETNTIMIYNCIMTTLKIHENISLDKTEFNSLSELEDYYKPEHDFHAEFIETIETREQELIYGKVKAKNWVNIKTRL